ncbi:MAG: helix-turn-helix domain-containing protein [Clostridiales bacterium]|nr:helix-turn-helix domain-containing protein [Clostridiales bacterium]
MQSTLKTWFESLDQTEVRLLAGERSLDQPLLSVCVTERPTALRVKHCGTLVFVSGVAFNKLGDLLQIARYAVEGTCCGLVVRVGTSLPVVPREVISFCSKVELPLFSASGEATIERLMQAAFQVIEQGLPLRASQETALRLALSASEWDTHIEEILQREGFFPQGNYRVVLFESLECRQKAKQIILAIRRKMQVVVPTVLIDNRLVSIFHNANYSEVWKNLQTLVEEKDFLYLIGEEYSGLRGIFRSYDEARKLLLMQAEKKLPCEIHNCSEANLCRLAQSLKGTALLEELREIWYLPLEESDRNYGTDFLSFVRTFLYCDGLTKEIAQKLGIHRNTVLYKIHRVEKLLGCSLQRIDVRMYLMLVLSGSDQSISYPFDM